MKTIDKIQVQQLSPVKHHIIGAFRQGNLINGKADPLVSADQQVDHEQRHNHTVNNGPGQQILWAIGNQPLKKPLFEFEVRLTNSLLKLDFLATKKIGGNSKKLKKMKKLGSKVPTWRNIALTSPYFSYGTVQTLPDAVRVMAACQLHTTLTDKQVRDIVAFLDSLTGKPPRQTLPQLPETPNTTILMGVPALTKAAQEK